MLRKFVSIFLVLSLLTFIVSCNSESAENSGTDNSSNNNSEVSEISNTEGATSTDETSNDESSTDETSTDETSKDESSIDEPNGIDDILSILKEYNFITDDEAEIGYDETITRSQALKIVMRLSNIENYALDTEWGTDDNPGHTFTDVSDEMSPYVSCALNIGLIKDSSQMFFGDRAIRADEYITWLLRALDYDDSYGNFKTFFPWELSDRIGLTDGQYNNTESFTFEDVLSCSYNALRTPMRNSSFGLYYYNFVYNRINVEYPEVFNVTDENSLSLDEFDSNENVLVGETAVGTIHYSGSVTDLDFIISNDGIIAFEFTESTESNGTASQGYKITALKHGTASVEITFSDEESTDIAFINVTSTDENVAFINEKLDIILSNANSDSLADDLIAEHPDEFNAIVDLGEEAIPALQYINSKLYDPGLYTRAQLTYLAMYTIKPDMFDVSYTSPSGKYALKGVVESFAFAKTVLGITYKAQIIDKKTDSIIFESDDSYNNINAEWSPDGRYVAVSTGWRYWSDVVVLDAEGQKQIDMVGISEIAEIFSDQYTIDGSGGYGNYFFIDEWVDDNKLKVEIRLDRSLYEIAYTGWYIYDLANEEIEEIELVYVLED